MTAYNAVSSLKNAFVNQFLFENQDRVYLATCVITTMAMTALSYYAPVVFFSQERLWFLLT